MLPSGGALIRRIPAPGRWWPWLVLALALAGKLLDPLPIAQLQRVAFDYLQRLAPRPSAETPIQLVVIDDESLARIGQWPWPRDVLAQLLDQLREAGARLAVFEVIFAEPDRTSPRRVLSRALGEAEVPEAFIGRLRDHDEVLAAAMRGMPAVLGFALSEAAGGEAPPAPYSISFSGPDPRPFLPGYTGAIASIPLLGQAAAGNGMVNALPDPDGTNRRVPLFATASGKLYPSLMLETLRVLVGDTAYRLKTAGGAGEASFGTATGMVALRLGNGAAALTVPVDAAGTLHLHLSRAPVAQPIAAWRILEGSVAPALIAERVVMIGPTAKGLVDLQQTALGALPSLELHAQALAQMMLGDFIQRPDWANGFEPIVIALLGALLILALPRLSPVAGALAAALSATALAGASWLAFTRLGWQFDAVYPTMTVLAVYATSSLSAFIRSDRDRAFIRDAFGRYLSPALAKRLADDPKALRLSGERRQMSFMFTDIAGFTGLSEQIAPAALASILNEYFDGACAVVMAHGATVNEFMGDGISAFFGAPLEQEDHAERALIACRALDDFAERFRKAQQDRGVPFGTTRIGIHSGTALVGNFGSSQRFKYTAIGDVVNTASRIEGLNKFFGTRSLISGTTATYVADHALRMIGRVVVSGRTEALEVFELLPHAAFDDDFVARYRAAYRALDAGDTSRALADFQALHRERPADGPTEFHLARLQSGVGSTLIVMNEK